MSKIILVLIKDSILCEETKKNMISYLQKYPSIKLKVIYFDEAYYDKDEIGVDLEGFPCFLIYDDTNKLIDKFIGGDSKTIEKVVKIALNSS